MMNDLTAENNVNTLPLFTAGLVESPLVIRAHMGGKTIDTTLLSDGTENILDSEYTNML
jgi:hypothetical protein